MALPKKKIVMLHGRGQKPGREALLDIWRSSLAAGLRRDAPNLLQQFDETPSELIYFADEVAGFDQNDYDGALDLSNRNSALERLAKLDKPRQFRRRNYEALPGKSAVKEFVMDLSAVSGLGAVAVGRALPELKHYWQDPRFNQDVRQRTLYTLKTSLDDGCDVLILSHCMGSVIAYDVLWQLGHETRVEQRVSTWITMGSPLGSNFVQTKLQGHGEKGARRYPVSVREWQNISAEDDYICHDKTVGDDFKEMLERRLIGSISDYTVYNLAVRYGRSNPHSSLGYLIHPRVTRCLSDWLSA